MIKFIYLNPLDIKGVSLEPASNIGGIPVVSSNLLPPGIGLFKYNDGTFKLVKVDLTK